MAVPDGIVSGDARAAPSTIASATTDEVIPFVTADGRAGNVVHVVGHHAPVRGPVILVHGAGVRANTKQLTTFRVEGPDAAGRWSAFADFGRLFAGPLWEVFAPWKRAAARQGAVGA